MSGNEELEQFKQIDLTAYAASLGYEVDRKRTSRTQAVMKNPRDGHKIVIMRGRDHHWVYFAINSDCADRGSILDLVMHRQGVNLGGARRILRDFNPEGYTKPEGVPKLLEPLSRDLTAVRAAWEAAEPLRFGEHDYLNANRKLPSSLLSQPRLADRIRVDRQYGNALFGHFNREGICGFVLKNKGFSGFSKGGQKGLWCSRGQEEDERLVIAEAAINALSYLLTHNTSPARLFSTGGGMNDHQPDYLVSAIQNFPRRPGGTVLIARDNDVGGEKFAAKIADCFQNAKRDDLTLVDDPPSQSGMDWNDVVQATSPMPQQG